MSPSHELIDSQPARYFPIHAGRYEIGAGLYRMDCDLGNGAKDSKIFQLDANWPRYRRHKMRSRSERLDKYVCESIRRQGALAAAVEFILRQLTSEYPAYFALQTGKEGGWHLNCALSGETLYFEPGKRFLHTALSDSRPRYPDPPYVSALDALACQIQEDLALIEIGGEVGDRVAALHLCYPNHWAAQDKIGCSFAEVHNPVPGFERIAKQRGSLFAHLLANGPYQRFAWGLASDKRLNHHPQAPTGCLDKQAWWGRGFRREQPKLYLRIERQVIVGLPDAEALLFSIRTYFEDVASFGASRIDALVAAIQSMDADMLLYKGIASHRDEILDWLALRRRSLVIIE